MEMRKKGKGFFYTTATTTKPRLEHFQYEWKLENFSRFYQTLVETFIALCRHNTRYKWIVRLYPKHCQTISSRSMDHMGRFILINVDRQYEANETKKETDGYRAKITLLNEGLNIINAEAKSLTSKTTFGLIASREAVLQAIRPSDKLIVRIDLDVVVEIHSICSFVSKVVKPKPKEKEKKERTSSKSGESTDDSDFYVLGENEKNSHDPTGVSDPESEDDWVVADVAETSAAAPDAVLEKFEKFCASKCGKGPNSEQRLMLTNAEDEDNEKAKEQKETEASTG